MTDPHFLTLPSSAVPVWFLIGWMMVIGALVVFNTGLMIRQLLIIMDLHMFHSTNSELVRKLLAKGMMPEFSSMDGHPPYTWDARRHWQEQEEDLFAEYSQAQSPYQADDGSAAKSESGDETGPDSSASPRKGKGKSKWAE